MRTSLGLRFCLGLAVTRIRCIQDLNCNVFSGNDQTSFECIVYLVENGLGVKPSIVLDAVLKADARQSLGGGHCVVCHQKKEEARVSFTFPSTTTLPILQRTHLLAVSMVGIRDGALLPTTVGMEDGVPEGIMVGAVEFTKLGAVEGSMVGVSEGTADSTRVGIIVASTSDGDMEGESVTVALVGTILGGNVAAGASVGCSNGGSEIGGNVPIS